MYVRIVGPGVQGRVGVCMMWSCDNEDHEHGVGSGVNVTLLSETL